MAKMPNSIRSLSIYEDEIARLQTFRVTHPLPAEADLLARIGFFGVPNVGDSIVPRAVGPHTTFNASGRRLVRKDLPKISQSRMVWSTWKDWHGHPHSGTKIVSRQVYQKDLIPPPEEAITLLANETGKHLVSRPLSRESDGDATIVHIINVFLELFGSLKLTTIDLQAPSAVVTRRLAWRILPQGEYPFERASSALQQFMDQVAEKERPVVVERIKSVTQYRPDFIAVGVGGFSDYVVFGFQQRNLYVLESPALGNATYIFNSNWEELSALTKREILAGNLHQVRLVHNHLWRKALRTAIIG
ncbi:MAG: hypothetical protein QM742_09050 [Aquabacterium sp.]